jgi:hypothetical protein
MTALTNVWIPGAFSSALTGLAIGGALGVVGLWLSRWEASPDSLHYTPNRWLVLAITLVVAARVVYGMWRGWNSWGSSADDSSVIAAFGIAGSLAAAAIGLGYYLAYFIGLRWRISRWQHRPLRVMREL